MYRHCHKPMKTPIMGAEHFVLMTDARHLAPADELRHIRVRLRASARGAPQIHLSFHLLRGVGGSSDVDCDQASPTLPRIIVSSWGRRCFRAARGLAGVYACMEQVRSCMGGSYFSIWKGLILPGRGLIFGRGRPENWAAPVAEGTNTSAKHQGKGWRISTTCRTMFKLGAGTVHI